MVVDIYFLRVQEEIYWFLICRCVVQWLVMCVNMELFVVNGFLQVVYFVYKFEYKMGCWFVLYLIWCVSLFNIVLVYYNYMISYFGCFFLIVGYKNVGEFQFFMELMQLVMQFFMYLCIQCVKWFIKQQNLWFYSQCVCQCYVLFLVVGKLCWIMICQMGKLDYFQ